MLRTAKPWAPRTREPQLYRDLERSPWESTRLFFTSRTGGAFFSETSIFLLTEAVVTLAVYFFFSAHISLHCSHDLNPWNKLVLLQLAIEVKQISLLALLLHLEFKYSFTKATL